MKMWLNKNKKNSLYNMWLSNGKKDSHKWHHYFDIYNKYFPKFYNKPINFLEIGVFKGGSLRLWKKYFGKHANIFAIDYNQDTLVHQDLKNKIKIFHGKQTDENFLNDVVKQIPGKIDIVIDDGGIHQSMKQGAFEILYPKISPNGVYIIEGLQPAYWKESTHRDTEKTVVERAKEYIDQLNAYNYSIDSFHRCRPPRDNRDPLPKDVIIPEFTKMTHCISFYDGVIVFEKRAMQEPWQEHR